MNRVQQAGTMRVWARALPVGRDFRFSPHSKTPEPNGPGFFSRTGSQPINSLN